MISILSEEHTIIDTPRKVNMNRVKKNGEEGPGV
jgi:hypothetical protein